MAGSAFTGSFSLTLSNHKGSFHGLYGPRGINKTAWDVKLILMADLAFPVSCASLGHLLMVQHCPSSLNICFNLPMAPHPPPPPIHPL